MYQEDIWVTREELYREVWAEPMIQVAKRYKISDVALKKVCVKMDIPVPPRGYWAKLQAGKKISKLPLGKLAPGKKDRTRILGAGLSFAEEFRQIKANELRKEPEKIPDLTVADRLIKPHALIQDTITALKLQRSRTKTPYDQIPRRLDVRADRESHDRAFRILDTLFKALEAEGHQIRISDHHKTEIVAFGEKIGLRVDERKDYVSHVGTGEELARAKRDPWYEIPSTDAVPTGDLSIKLDAYTQGCRKNWGDGKKQRLESILPEVYIGILAVADSLRARTLYWEEERRKQRESEMREAELRFQQEQEEVRSKLLLSLAKRHRNICSIATFISEVEMAVSNHPDQAVKSGMESWLSWANREMARIDPVDELIRIVSTGEW